MRVNSHIVPSLKTNFDFRPCLALIQQDKIWSSFQNRGKTTRYNKVHDLQVRSRLNSGYLCLPGVDATAMQITAVKAQAIKGENIFIKTYVSVVASAERRVKECIVFGPRLMLHVRYSGELEYDPWRRKRDHPFS